MAPRHGLITGGSSGIGLALARRLAAEGWALSLCARRQEQLDRARAELISDYPHAQVDTYSADVSDAAAITAVVEQAIARHGAPDLLVTSAGLARPGHFHELEAEVFERTMAVNYFGTLNAVRAALPAMRAAGRGRIVMLSSGAGLIGVYGYSAYGPSKFAIRGLGEVLRGELRPEGIGVSVVFPPDTDTPQLAEENRYKPEETRRIAGNAALWSADGVARAILRGIQRDRFHITPGWEMTALARLGSLLNPLLQHYFDRLIAAVRRGE